MIIEVKVKKGLQQFRRAGILFTENPQKVEVTPKQRDLIAAEPMLVLLAEEKVKETPDNESDNKSGNKNKKNKEKK